MKDYDSERNQFGSILHAVRRKHQTMIEHSLFYYPYAPFTNAQLPGLTVAAQDLEKLYILDPVDARLETFSADYHARRAVKLLMDEKIAILQTMRPADVLAPTLSAGICQVRDCWSCARHRAASGGHSRWPRCWRVSRPTGLCATLWETLPDRPVEMRVNTVRK
jgi:hypothetical protein